jgi:LPS sulfotransferase NodH
MPAADFQCGCAGPGRRELGLPDFPDAPELQMEAILRLGATPNGVYAVKLFASQFAAFSGRLRWMDLLPNLHFVYLTRDDLLGQAISWARALQTEQYRSTQPAKRPAVYDADLIRSQLTAIVRERAQRETLFCPNRYRAASDRLRALPGGSIELCRPRGQSHEH